MRVTTCIIVNCLFSMSDMYLVNYKHVRDTEHYKGVSSMNRSLSLITLQSHGKQTQFSIISTKSLVIRHIQ